MISNAGDCIVELVDDKNRVNGQKEETVENNYKENLQHICVNSAEISERPVNWIHFIETFYYDLNILTKLLFSYRK